MRNPFVRRGQADEQGRDRDQDEEWDRDRDEEWDRDRDRDRDPGRDPGRDPAPGRDQAPGRVPRGRSRRRGLVRSLLAVGCGALPALAFPAPGLWWWAYLALVPWLLLI
ncbi:hypothetical protein ACWCQ0_50690, partial [Streptomyces massasporeus]